MWLLLERELRKMIRITDEYLTGHCRTEFRGKTQLVCVVNSQNGERRHERRPVDQRQAFLGFQRHRLQAAQSQDIGSGLDLCPVAAVPHPGQ